MDSKTNEGFDLLSTALEEVNSLFDLVGTLSEEHRKSVLDKLKLRLSSFETDKNGSESKTTSKRKFCKSLRKVETETENPQILNKPKIRTSSRPKKLTEKAKVLLNDTKFQAANRKTNASTALKEEQALKAGTVRPFFLKLVPLSPSQIKTSSRNNANLSPPGEPQSDAQVDAKCESKPSDIEDLWEEDVDDPDYCENYSDDEEDLDQAPKTKKKSSNKTVSAFRNGQKTFICEICGKSFNQKAGLDIHLKRHNGIKSFACALCNYNAVCKIEILRHMSKHTGERNYPCKFCEKSFTSDCSLRNHIKHIHIRSEKVICNHCPFQTHSKDILKRHYLIKHTKKEQFECPICQEIIKQKGSFMVHLRKHTGERPYHCTTCTKSFKSSSQLAAHKRTHRPGEYLCTYCTRYFKTKHQLDRHKIIHTGEKPYVCHLCTYACNVKTNITKHIKSVHKVNSFSFKEPYPKSTGPDDNPDALERGFQAADEYLKEHTLKAGEILTLDDLKRQSKEQRESEQEAKMEELKRRKPKAKKVVSATVPELPVSDLQPSSDMCTSEKQIENKDVYTDVCISESTQLVDSSTTDILSNAVQLLNSPVQDSNLDECDMQYKAADETVNIPIEIGSNMFIIQVVSDQSLTF